MRAPTFLMLTFLASSLAGCSKAAPSADSGVANDIEFALQHRASTAVASALEVGSIPKAKPHVAAAPDHRAMAHGKTLPRPAVPHETAPAEVSARVRPEPVGVATASEPEAEPEPVAATQPSDVSVPQTSPEPAPQPTRGGRGGWLPIPIDMGVRRPGMGGGIIIIRGGMGSGSDPCAHDGPSGGFGIPGRRGGVRF